MTNNLLTIDEIKRRLNELEANDKLNKADYYYQQLKRTIDNNDRLLAVVNDAAALPDDAKLTTTFGNKTTELSLFDADVCGLFEEFLWQVANYYFGELTYDYSK